jgi:tRNA threonylcarbamoyladenosine biosynthesis protein TsaB
LSILLIECSSKKISFGFADRDKLILEKTLDENFNADTLTFFIKEELSNLQFDFHKPEYVSISNGPGSFTGLRIGSAIAKGICFASECRLIEVPTLDIIANKFKSESEVISLIYSNMRSGEFYFCRYKFENEKLLRVGDYGISSKEEILKNKGGAHLVSNDTLEFEYENVSGRSDIESQFELCSSYIKNNLFSDYKISHPFYMKEFIPKV